MNKRLTIDEIKQKELDILQVVDQFCKDNQIDYFINYGTLLGAIRHQGFIPWDDDIDLSMTRENYEKFMTLFNDYSDQYKIQSLITDKKYYNNFLKVIDTHTKIEEKRMLKQYDMSIFIDIFPLDYYNDQKVIQKGYILESLKLLTISRYKHVIHHDSLLKDCLRTVMWLVLRPFSPRFFAKRIEKLIKRYQKADGKYAAVIGSKLKMDEVFVKEDIQQLIELPFEQLKVKAPKHYEVILKQFYGNYMELPPIEKRVYPHEIEAYLKK